MALFTSLLLFLVQQDRKTSSIAARINNEIITVDELNADLKRKGLPPDEQVRRATLRQLAEKRIILQEAKRLGIKVETKEVDAALQRDIQTGFKTEDEYNEWLASRKMTRQQHRTQIEEILLEQGVMGRKYSIWINDPEAGSRPVHGFATPQELREYYEANRREFEAREYVKLARITLQFQTEQEKREKTKAANSVLRRLEAGTDFILIAQLASDVKGSPVLDTFDRNSKLFSPAVTAEIMDKLAKGQVSGILEDAQAIHVVKVLDKVVRRGESFEEAQPKIQRMREYEKRTKNRELLIKDLIRGSYFYPSDLFEGQDR